MLPALRTVQGLGLLLLAGLGCRGEGRAQPGAGRKVAAPVAAVPAPACEGPRSLRVPLQKGEYLHAIAEQGARDVAVTLSDARGRRLLTVDSLGAPAPPWPAEEVHWVADESGEIRLDVTLLPGSRGPCALRLAERRPASAADRERARVEAALARAHALRRTGDERRCREAIVPYGQAERGFAALGLTRRRAETLFGLGLLDLDCLHDNPAALRAFTRAAPLFAGDGGAEGTVRERLGELRFARGDLDAAIDEYRRALALRRRTGDRAGEALTSSNLGHALDLRGRYDEAASLFDRSLALWGEGDKPSERAKTNLNRGQLHRELGETDRARGRFAEALALYRRAGDREGEAAALNAMGLVSLDEGRPGAALQPLAGALALRRPGTRGRAVTLTTLGVAYRRLGRSADARRAYAEAAPIFEQLGDAREQARSLGDMGWLEAAAGSDGAALADFDRAATLFARVVDPPERAWALRGKAEALRHRGDLRGARGAMEGALTAVERHRFRQQSYTTRAAFFATQQDSYDFLIDLLMEMRRRSPRAGYAAAALGVNERALARSLLDGLAASGADLRSAPGAAPALLARERGLEGEIDALVARQTRLDLEPGATSAQRRPLDSELAQRWEELDRVRADLRAANPRYAALTQPQPWSAGEIRRRLLGRDTLLLEYRLGAGRSFLWAVTPGKLASFELPGRAAIEAVAGRACDLAARSRGRKAAIAADLQLARAGRLLLGPVASLLPGKRLLIVGDGILQHLPWAALPETAGGEPLVARHEIVSLPSVSVLGVLRREVAGRSPAPKTLWVLADPAFGGAFAPLPHTRQEAAAILAFAPPGDHTAVLGEAASRQAVLRAPLRDYRFLHFATHGSFAAGDPGGGRLVLAQRDGTGRPAANGFLYLADIYELALRADLVVLSACESALGREVRGEGLMGMTRGFFYAGAERVLVSLWNVNDRVSAELMQRLYRGMLRQGLSPAAALRAAQDAIRRQERWRAPYYWAGFTLQGEWRGGDRRARLNPP